MLKMRNIGFITLIWITSVVPVSAAYQLVLQAGHEGTPAAMEWHAKSGTIVSAGNDGRLIVTRPSDGRVLHRFRVADSRIHDMKIDPTDDRAAVITSAGGKFSVTVWDWSDEKIVYSHEMDTEPLFVSWSAQGRYLTIGNLSSPSIIVLEGNTGRRLSYLQRLPSLYNAGYVGSTETILMTYNTSGSIRYWDIRSSALKLSAETVSNLQGITVLQTDSKSTLFGYRNDNMYLINRETGAVLDQRVIPGLQNVSVDDENGDIDVLARGVTGAVVHEYGVRDERFLPRGFVTNGLLTNAVPVSVDPSFRPAKILRRNSSTFILAESGRLYRKSGGVYTPVIQSRLWRPDSLVFQNETLRVTGGAVIREFTSPFFNGGTGTDIEDLETLILNERKTGSRSIRTGIDMLPGGDILQWDIAHSGPANGIRRINAIPGAPEQFFPVSGMIQKVEIIDATRFLVLDRSGKVSIRNTLDGSVLFEYSALGVLDAGYSGDNNYILTGRSSQGRAGSALEQVDTATKETVPIPDDRFMIYGINKGPRGIYSTGVIRQSSGSSETSLLLHDENRPAEAKTIVKVSGEDLGAIVLPHPDGNSVYTTLGGSVQRIIGSRKTPFNWDETISELRIRGDVLYGLDADGAIVMWNGNSGKALLKVYLFDDGGWIAMPPGGDRIWASPGAIENVMIYRDGRAVDPKRVSLTVTGIDEDLN